MSRPALPTTRCPFCNQVLPSENPTRRSNHFKACSTSLRNDVRNRLDAAGDPTLLPYHAAMVQMQRVIKSPEDSKKATYARIARMWRANELVGRGDYLAQSTDMADGDEDILDILTPLLSSSTSSIQSVLAIEDSIFAYPRTFNRYTSLIDTPNPLPVQDLDDDEEEERLQDRLFEHLDNRRPIASFARDFRPHHPLWISGQIVTLQLEERFEKDLSGPEPGWVPDQERMLVRLLGEGLPIVEIVRRLNAEVRREGVVARTRAQVENKVDLMLE